ncbi:MAG: AmmeMemoRadiSam system protein B [Actinomycetota bacterium]
MSPRYRRPAAAGIFYPSDPGQLAGVLDRLLADATEPPPGEPMPEGLIVPHAGYVYSGPVAATAYARLRPFAAVVARAVILGPAHYVPLAGAAVPGVDGWRTPLGDAPLDRALRDAAVEAGAVIDDGPHEPEHSLEVQIPFLQRVLGDGFAILPVAVGVASPGQVADLLGVLLAACPGGPGGAPGVFTVISTDLSHYLDHETARLVDRRTADAILARDPGAVGGDDACGLFALRGVLEHARRRELDVRLLDLRTSGDTAGDRRRVVGYGAFGLWGEGGHC